MKIVITGSRGLLGWHAAARVHAANQAAEFCGNKAPFTLNLLDHDSFDDDEMLHSAVQGADVILHFAGVNRGNDHEVEEGNPKIAERLKEACLKSNSRPHIVYANSIHSTGGSSYARSKRLAGEIIAGIGGSYTDLLLPHIYGEGARPDYNNVTATFIAGVIAGRRPAINPSGRVMLLHAGSAVTAAISCGVEKRCGPHSFAPHEMRVSDLYDHLERFHADYSKDTFPDLRDPFQTTLFNTYRFAIRPVGNAHQLKLNVDARGTLFEAVKGGGGGQTFASTTAPGVTRGNHFHLNKVERFLVLQGSAVIRMRKVLSDEVREYHISGQNPTTVDMPTLYTHSIQNVGDTPLLTLFWTHDIFDRINPDTYADSVLR